VPLDRLSEELINLPLAAWPYGRVVAIQPQGLGGASDRRPIARNVQATKAVLTALPVVIDPWRHESDRIGVVVSRPLLSAGSSIVDIALAPKREVSATMVASYGRQANFHSPTC